ncbi:MAG: PilZ domain-containing protein [Syntrophobacterales bacterium]
MNTLRRKRGHHYPKVDANYPVLVLTADGPLRGKTKHISTQQAFVRCEDPLRLYDVASLSIEVAKNESLLVAEAEVIWSNRYGPDDEITPRGMVVRFTRLATRERQRLQKAIVRHYKAKMKVHRGRRAR